MDNFFDITKLRLRNLEQNSGNVTDGNKGDLTVSGSGTVWNINTNAVTDNEINDVDADKVTESALKRFTTDTEKSTWNAKQNNISAISGGSFVFVSQKSDLPTPSAGVITLAAGVTYFFTDEVDLTGDRLVCGINTTITNLLDIQAKFSSSSANNSIYSDIFILNKIY